MSDEVKIPNWLFEWKKAYNVAYAQDSLREDLEIACASYIQIIEEVKDIDKHSRILIALYREIADIYGALGEKKKQKECLKKALKYAQIITRDTIEVQKSLKSLGEDVEVDSWDRMIDQHETSMSVGDVKIFVEKGCNYTKDAEEARKIHEEMAEDFPLLQGFYIDQIGDKSIMIASEDWKRRMDKRFGSECDDECYFDDDLYELDDEDIEKKNPHAFCIKEGTQKEETVTIPCALSKKPVEN